MASLCVRYALNTKPRRMLNCSSTSTVDGSSEERVFSKAVPRRAINYSTSLVTVMSAITTTPHGFTRLSLMVTRALSASVFHQLRYSG